jgi:hypothetical protein
MNILKLRLLKVFNVGLFPNVFKIFTVIIMNICNKLECLSLASLFSLI